MNANAQFEIVSVCDMVADPTITYSFGTLAEAIDQAEAGVERGSYRYAYIMRCEDGALVYDTRRDLIPEAPIEEPPQEPNPYEEANRLRKVQAIIEFIDRCLADKLIQRAHLTRIAAWTDTQWDLIAKGAQVKNPSGLTRRMVAEHYTVRAHWAEVDRQRAGIAARSTEVLDYAKARR